MKKLLVTAAVLSVLAGCASVPMADTAASNAAKEFKDPTVQKAGIYVYRTDTSVGAALKKDVWIDDKCVGETAKGVFFYEEVDGDSQHKISTESEFSPNDLVIEAKAGELYFVEQYIKMGVFVGGAGLKQVDSVEGKSQVSQLNMAVKGKCSA